MKSKILLIALMVAFGTNAIASKKIASTLGWNATDATACINAAINFAADTIIIDKQASDWISGQCLIMDVANKTIIFEAGVVVKAKVGAFNDQYTGFFVLIRATNISIIGYGATIKMNQAEYVALPDAATGGFRHTLSINNCNNINVYGLKLMDSGGDGILISGDTWNGTQLYSENILLKDIWCDNNYRQGISVISVQHLLVQNCMFTNTGGTWPMAGVDIEPDHPQHRIVDVVFEKCRFTDNEKNGIIVAFHRLDSTSLPVDATFRDCYSGGNRGDYEIYAIDWLEATSKGNVRFERCMVENSQKSAVVIRKKATNYFVTFDNCAFVNVSKSGGANYPIKVEVPDYPIPGIRYGGVAFNNCLLSYSSAPAFFKTTGSSSKSPGMGNVQLNNLTVIHPNATINIDTTYDGGNVAADCVFDFQNFTSAPATNISFSASNSGLSDCDVTNSVLTATRSSGDLSFPISVTYTLTGTASPESDFSRIVGSMVIPKDATDYSDTLFILKDSEVESTESIGIALTASPLFTSGSSTLNLSIYDCAGYGADTIITFEDRPKAETELTGVYANINWGTSAWATYSETSYSPANKVLKMNSIATTQQIDTLIILSGKTLKSLNIASLGNPAVKEGVLSSTGNPDRTWTDMTAAFSTYHTNWTVVSDTIIIKVTCDLGASFIIFDDLSFGDVLAPTIPVGLASSAITYTSATLSWTSSVDNVGVNNYEVFKDGEFIGSTDSTWLIIEGLTCNTLYSLTVKASDNAGNWSETSNPLLVTMAECDIIAPSVPFGLNSSNITSTSFTLSWSGSIDNDAVAGYDVFNDGVKYDSASSVLGQNVVSNPGFEEGFSVWDNWSDNAIWAKDTTANYYSGAKSMRLISPPSGGAGFGQSVATTNFSEGDILVANCHARWDIGLYNGDNWDGCSMGIQVVYGDKKENFEVLISGINGDSLYTVTTPPLKAGFTKIYIFGYRWLQLPGKIVYYDDFSLVKKTNEINITGLVPSTSYSMTVKALDVSGNFSESSEALVVTTNNCLLPSEWKVAEIGATGQYSCESNGVFTLIGAGADIWGTADQFIYTYKSIIGDGIITAKVESIQNTDPWAKSGVMIRENLTVGSKYVDCLVTPVNGIGFQNRPVANSACTALASSAGISAPYWVRMERIGNTFNAYQSADGSTWTQIGNSATLVMSTNVYFGLAVTSHLVGTTCTSVLSNVSTQGLITDVSETLATDVNSGILVYPNPLTGQLLSIESAKGAESVAIIDITGRLVFSQKLKDLGKQTVDLNNKVQKGSFIIKVTTKTGNVSQLLIVQ